MMQPLMVAEAFGLKAYGRIYSLTQLCMTAGATGLPPSVSSSGSRRI